MNNEFQEKLQLYKEGKLNQNEVKEIEFEIDKFTAMMDYLNDDEKAFLEELTQQIPQDNEEENRPAKLLKRKVNLRIIMMTAISVFSILIIFIFLYFSTSKITTSLFGLDQKEAYVKRATMVQFTQMFNPQYKSNSSGVDKLPFAKQYIQVSLDNTVGNMLIDETEIKVRYSFGKPFRSETSLALQLLPIDDDLSLLNSPDPVSGFKPLENAPEGTKAKIYIVFNKALTPEELKEYFTNQINTVDATPLEFTPLASIGSKFIISNPSYYVFTPVYPYGSNNAKQNESNNLKQIQYENMDDKAHKESFISNLNLIKSNKRLLQVMYYEDMFEITNIDDIIKDVENNGVKYVGMYICAGSKELLKLKNNPMIQGVRVENIVVW
jgi:hypothetical protein